MDVSDFDPETGHLKHCRVSTDHPSVRNSCDEDCAKVLLDMLPKVDRNARAYGWECGRAGGLLVEPVTAKEDNPFLNPDWRDRLAP